MKKRLRIGSSIVGVMTVMLLAGQYIYSQTCIRVNSQCNNLVGGCGNDSYCTGFYTYTVAPSLCATNHPSSFAGITNSVATTIQGWLDGNCVEGCCQDGVKSGSPFGNFSTIVCTPQDECDE